MEYITIRELVEKLGTENYENFIKSLISYEKRIDDMNVLDKMYQDYMDSCNSGFLNESFNNLNF